MNRTSVLLLFGGESSEHDVSIMSARNVYAAMDNEKYDVKLCYIDRHGKWWLLEDWIDDLSRQHGGAQLSVVPGMRSFLTIPGSRVIPVDVVFPVLHGKNGEDGTVQGLLDVAHVPYVGCGVEASVVCMDKDATKRLLRSNGVSVTDWLSVPISEDVQKLLADQAAIETQVGGGSWFVKPSRAGSSVGVTKVKEYGELASAIALAHQYDTMALIEPAVTGRELEVAVLGNESDIRISGVGEIITGAEFYDYEDKYSPTSSSRVDIHPELDEQVKLQIQQIAEVAYRAVGGRGLSRLDFFLADDGTILLNEINTMPGFTNISMYPKLWQAEGVDYSQLIDTLIELARK